jgi:hypothetical protein
MEKINQFGKPVHVLAVMAIAFTGISTPTMASTDLTSSSGSLKLAQASLVGQCRAAKQQIPIYRGSNITSEAIVLLPTDGQVILAENSANANGFISISAPVPGFVQAINLRPCNGGAVIPPNTAPNPSNQSLCRQVVRPPQGLLIRREPRIAAEPPMGGIAYLGRVTITTNPATVKRADNRDWVEISSPVRGWVSNGLVTEPNSNLVYCK